jgi:THO complex subunit 1
MEARCKLVVEALKASLSLPSTSVNEAEIVLEALYTCYGGTCTLSSMDIAIEVDLIFRGHMDSLLQCNGLVDDIIADNSSIRRMLDLCIQIGNILPQFCESKVSFDGINILSHVQKMPLILIDDLLLAQTISKTKKLWDLVEKYISILHKTAFFAKGQLLALKICNAVLKKLSKSRDTEFCGRILMLLSAIFPITDRSALNIGGEINISNQSTFDSEQEFSDHRALYSASSTVSKNAALDAMELVPKEGEDGEEAEEFDETSPSYSLYKTFWGLQTYLCGPLPKPDQLTNAVAIDATTLSSFIIDVNTVFASFEKIQFSDTKSGETSTTSTDAYMGSKYLTSSQLFSLQLKDPVLRVQVLSQILSYIKYLRCKSFDIKFSSPAVATKESGALLKNFDELELAAYALLCKVPPYGAQTKIFLQQLLHRESSWVKWKTLKPTPCPEFVRRPVERRPVVEELPSKRSRGSHADGIVSYYFDHSDASIRAASRKLVEDVPSYDQHIEVFLDAEDPEAGIDEEYHPRHDGVYCWRARRLLAMMRLDVFEHMADGDLRRGLSILHNFGANKEPVKEEDLVDKLTTESECVIKKEEEIEVVQMMDVETALLNSANTSEIV